MQYINKANEFVKSLQCPTQQALRQAINDEPWGPHGKVMQELADASVGEADEIIKFLTKKLDCNGKQWRQCYKSLIVVEFLATHGPSSLTWRYSDLLPQIRDISHNFNYKDEKGDHGLSVRERARKVVDL
eukprot:Sspe_Gene.89601::Locus_61344_Transcript_1_1_Confidence_1.000_Length_1539::g.89601::m.89601/K12471/EPN; epsin